MNKSLSSANLTLDKNLVSVFLHALRHRIWEKHVHTQTFCRTIELTGVDFWGGLQHVSEVGTQ